MTYSPEETQRLLSQWYPLIVHHASSYDERHAMVAAVASVQRKSETIVEPPMTWPFRLRLALTMAKFGLQHGRRDPHCPCMD